MGWLNEWADTASSTKQRLEREPMSSAAAAGAQMILGFSNLGIGIPVCSICSPDRVRVTASEAWGIDE